MRLLYLYGYRIYLGLTPGGLTRDHVVPVRPRADILHGYTDAVFDEFDIFPGLCR